MNMSEVSQLITTNKRFYIEGNVDDIIYQIQRKPIDSQTGAPSKWLCFHQLERGRVLAKHQPHRTEYPDYIDCWLKDKQVAVKKTAIKSIVAVDDDALVLSDEEKRLIEDEVCDKEGWS